jgi:hypothetical protein
MNTKVLLPFLITTLLVSGSATPGIGRAEPPIQVAQSVWKPFSSAEGNFTVLMPGTPRQEQNTINTELAPLDLNAFTVERPNEANYLVAYFDLPGDFSNMLQTSGQINEFLTGVVLGLSESMAGQLLNQQRINLNNYSGKAFRMQHSEDVVGRYRLYLVNQRVYLLGVGTSKENYLQKSIQGFFNSFRLAGGATGTVRPGDATETVRPPRSNLNAQLRQAVCTQNWSQAINVVNRMIGQIDSQDVRQQLLDYKQKLQGFASSDSVVPASELPDCSSGNGEGN